MDRQPLAHAVEDLQRRPAEPVGTPHHQSIVSLWPRSAEQSGPGSGIASITASAIAIGGSVGSPYHGRAAQPRCRAKYGQSSVR